MEPLRSPPRGTVLQRAWRGDEIIPPTMATPPRQFVARQEGPPPVMPFKDKKVYMDLSTTELAMSENLASDSMVSAADKPSLFLVHPRQELSDITSRRVVAPAVAPRSSRVLPCFFSQSTSQQGSQQGMKENKYSGSDTSWFLPNSPCSSFMRSPMAKVGGSNAVKPSTHDDDSSSPTTIQDFPFAPPSQRQESSWKRDEDYHISSDEDSSDDDEVLCLFGDDEDSLSRRCWRPIPNLDLDFGSNTATDTPSCPMQRPIARIQPKGTTLKQHFTTTG